MFRLLLVIALGIGSHLRAADFAGRWTGTVVTGGSRIPIHLTFNQHEGQITGFVATGDAKQAPIENPEIRGAQLIFAVHDNANRLVSFRLTLNGGRLAGESRVADQVSTIVAFGGGVFLPGGGVSRPELIHKVEPEYTYEARAAKLQGCVVLYAEIDPTGAPTNILVQRHLGMGPDEKAIEAVKQWKFKPGEKDGKPVTVPQTVFVQFRL